MLIIEHTIYMLLLGTLEEVGEKIVFQPLRVCLGESSEGALTVINNNMAIDCDKFAILFENRFYLIYCMRFKHLPR